MNKRSDTPPRAPAFATVPGTDYAALYAPEPIKPRITSTADTPRWGGTPARLRVQPGPAVSGPGLAVPRAAVPEGGAPASYPRTDDRYTAVMASPPTTFVTGGAEDDDDDPLDTPAAAAPPRASADPDTPGDHPDPHQPAPDALELMPPGAACGSRRQDGWSAANQRRFLEALAEGHGVDVAARRVGLSATSAYAFRRTAKGAVFALGWRAAALVARDSIAETLLVRALEGTVDTIVRGETVITRHKYDNRPGLALLARLDRQAESAPDADAKAARLVAQEFDAYLDLVGRDQGAARAGLFLARRTGGPAGQGPGHGPGQGAPMMPRGPMRMISGRSTRSPPPTGSSAPASRPRPRSISPISIPPRAPAGAASNGRAPRPPGWSRSPRRPPRPLPPRTTKPRHRLNIRNIRPRRRTTTIMTTMMTMRRRGTSGARCPVSTRPSGAARRPARGAPASRRLRGSRARWSAIMVTTTMPVRSRRPRRS
ncbi:hypothetical protein [Sphingomonas aerolata]|uniref:hypothetical protein n=1 Tax=Sphingomonas aerolata TaxID=185951 RepID=UPI002FE04CBC